MERFFEALEANADWLTTVDAVATGSTGEPPDRPGLRADGSYAEMGEWALPPDEAVVFTRLLHDAVAAEGRPEARWLRGGFWRNFQVKYREINDLHKQMLRTSRKVGAMPAGPARTAALDHLYRGQSNDCYWHGLFGGIYISHMRLATYEHLIAAEDLGRAARWARVRRRGAPSTSTSTASTRSPRRAPGRSSPSSSAEGAGIGAWDIRAARHALAARHAASARGVPRDPPRARGRGDPATPARRRPSRAAARRPSIHDTRHGKEAGLSRTCSSTTTTSDGRGSSISSRPTSRREAVAATARGAELGDFRRRRLRIVDLAPAARSSLARDGASALGQPITVDARRSASTAAGATPS